MMPTSGVVSKMSPFTDCHADKGGKCLSKGAPHETIFQISRALNGTEISRGNDLPNFVKRNSQVLLKSLMKLSAGKVTPKCQPFSPKKQGKISYISIVMRNIISRLYRWPCRYSQPVNILISILAG